MILLAESRKVYLFSYNSLFDLEITDAGEERSGKTGTSVKG
jgi:hypothetical protein